MRLMEMYSPQKLYGRSGVTHRGELELRLRQAFKPHSAPVTAIAYERNGEIMATGVGTECVYVCVCVWCGRLCRISIGMCQGNVFMTFEK